jgi:hypothetical protein
MIQDSGARREFKTGAVRDIAEGKGRCDLLPLGIIGKYTEDCIFDYIEIYIRTGNVDVLWEVFEYFCNKAYENILTGLLEVSKQYEEGAKKYDDRNWEKGIPLHCYIDSAVRHYLKWKRGDTDEPHDRAFVWNILGAIWTHKNKPELIDLPFIKETKKDCFWCGGEMIRSSNGWNVCADCGWRHKVEGTKFEK